MTTGGPDGRDGDTRLEGAQRVVAEVVDEALVSLGLPPVRANPYVTFDEPLVADLPTLAFDKPGAAPLRFVLGGDLDLWVGPFSEVVVLPAPVEAQRRALLDVVVRVLRSEVECRRGLLWTSLTLRLPGEEPWCRTRYLGCDFGPAFRHRPFA